MTATLFALRSNDLLGGAWEIKHMMEQDIVDEKLRRSAKIGAVASKLNDLIEDANSNGHPVYLEVAVWNGHLKITPIFSPNSDHARE